MSEPLDLLLKMDKTKLVRPIRQVEIKRLSEASGEPFVVTCQALCPDEFQEIQDMISVDTNEGTVKAQKNIQAEYVIKGVINPDFKNQQIIEYYGATNAAEAVTNIFLPGEITGLFNIINKLSGFGNDAVTEIKNVSVQTEN
jgi:hypothetical protein